MKGDGQQTGGVFVLGPGIGEDIIYSFKEIENDVTSFANTEDIIAACKE